MKRRRAILMGVALAASACAGSLSPLLPEGTGVRDPQKIWRRIEGAGFALELYRNGGVAVHFGEASLYAPCLNMRLTPGSGQLTPLAATAETRRGAIRELAGGLEAVITAQTSNCLEIVETYTVASNRLEISTVANANWLIARGSHPIYLGGMSFGSPHAPMTIVSRLGDTAVDRSCDDTRSLEFRHRGRIVRIEFSGSVRAHVDPGRLNGRYCTVNVSPLNVRNSIPPGESIGYRMTISVRAE
jgi:hypothetical protein